MGRRERRAAAKQQAQAQARQAQEDLSRPQHSQGKPNTRRMVAKRKETVEAGGRKWTISALVLDDWQYLAEMALKYYRREKMKTITQNADLLREAGLDAEKMIMERISELEDLSIDDLPNKEAAMPLLANDGTPIKVGGKPATKKMKMQYYIWYASFTDEGIAIAIWRSMLCEHPTLTLDEVEDMIHEEKEEALMQAIAQRVGTISNPESAKNE